MKILMVFVFVLISSVTNALDAVIKFDATGMDSYNFYVVDAEGNRTLTPAVSGTTSPLILPLPPGVNEIRGVMTGVDQGDESVLSNGAYAAYRPEVIEIVVPKAPSFSINITLE